MTLDPDIKAPTDYPQEGVGDNSAEPSPQDIEQVYSLADAARVADAWDDDLG